MTDPELKGRWLIPRRQKGDFGACWDEREAAFGGVCRWPLVVCCVRVDWTKKKSKFVFPGASGLVFLSLTSGLVFLIFFFRLFRQQELRYRDLRDTRSPNPLSFLSEQHGNTPVWRLEERPRPLASSAGSVSYFIKRVGRRRRLGPGFREATSAARGRSDREQRARFHKADSTERGGSSS